MMRLLTAFGFVAMLSGSAAALDVDTCGTTVPGGEIGVLRADLSCAGAFVVALERGATLDLNGHTATLTVPSGLSRAVVECETRRCSVGGPGTIRCNGTPSQYVTGIGMAVGGRLDVHDALIQGCDQGIWDMGTPGAKTRVYATDLVVLDSTFNGIEAEKLTATNVEASGNGFAGLAVEELRGTNITVDDNGDYYLPNHGISGISSFNGTVKVTGLVATNNAEHGVEAKKVILTDSTVVDNDATDIFSERRPRLTNVTCGTSGWGLCAND